MSKGRLRASGTGDEDRKRLSKLSLAALIIRSCVEDTTQALDHSLLYDRPLRSESAHGAWDLRCARALYTTFVFCLKVSAELVYFGSLLEVKSHAFPTPVQVARATKFPVTSRMFTFYSCNNSFRGQKKVIAAHIIAY